MINNEANGFTVQFYFILELIFPMVVNIGPFLKICYSNRLENKFFGGF